MNANGGKSTAEKHSGEQRSLELRIQDNIEENEKTDIYASSQRQGFFPAFLGFNFGYQNDK